MSLMFGNFAVEKMVGLLKSSCIACCNEGVSVFLYEKGSPIVKTGEYIAVNHLPFVHRGAVEEGVVNVNVHVPKTKNDEVPARRLKEIVESVASLFYPDGRYLEKAWFEFYADSRPTPDNDGTYFVNMQFKVIYNDLNY